MHVFPDLLPCLFSVYLEAPSDAAFDDYSCLKRINAPLAPMRRDVPLPGQQHMQWLPEYDPALHDNRS
jgi:hypothetical protein